MFDDFIELHGDRVYGDDAAIVGGLARFEGRSVVVIGHQKGGTRARRSRGTSACPTPRAIARRSGSCEMAAKFGKPIFTFIDTPGAYPGIGAEERGQAEAIARNLALMAGLRIPMIAVVTGEGGSGGALAIGMGNRVLMLEYAVYAVISPGGCAAILWGDAAKAAEAAAVMMRVTAPDLLQPRRHRCDRAGTAGRRASRLGRGGRPISATALREQLADLTGRSGETLGRGAPRQFRKLGAFEEASVPTR